MYLVFCEVLGHVFQWSIIVHIKKYTYKSFTNYVESHNIGILICNSYQALAGKYFVMLLTYLDFWIFVCWGFRWTKLQMVLLIWKKTNKIPCRSQSLRWLVHYVLANRGFFIEYNMYVFSELLFWIQFTIWISVLHIMNLGCGIGS